MRKLGILVQLVLLFIVFMSCKTDNNNITVKEQTEEENNVTDSTSNQLIIKIGSRTFSGTLVSNATATAFKARLPLTISMEELNSNEKFYRFSSSLPSNPTNPGTIQEGDLMLYTSNTLVLFYKTFSTFYPYTRIGKINDTSGLMAALGTGNVTVSFSLE